MHADHLVDRDHHIRFAPAHMPRGLGEVLGHLSELTLSVGERSVRLVQSSKQAAFSQAPHCHQAEFSHSSGCRTAQIRCSSMGSSSINCRREFISLADGEFSAPELAGGNQISVLSLQKLLSMLPCGWVRCSI